MNSTTKTAGIVAAVIVSALALGFACSGGGFQNGPTPAAEQTEAPDGDCDAGDLRESKPDPDCGGLWLGTPTPAAKRSTAPASRPTPRRTR
jgi:hypothetical protein